MKIILGTTVRLSNNIEKSMNRIGGSKEMKMMAGKRCEVLDMDRGYVRLSYNENCGWWFFKSDIEPNGPPKPKPKPVTFDPQNLVT